MGAPYLRGRDFQAGRGRGRARVRSVRMRAGFLLLLPLFLFCTGCESTIPEKVALVPGANTVEVVSDPPNPELYESVGEVSAQVVAREVGDGLRQAANDLRNQAAKKNATFV